MSQHAVAIKVGTPLMTAHGADHSLSCRIPALIAAQVKDLINDGIHPYLISSGAVGQGIDILYPSGTTRQQILEGLSEEAAAMRLRTCASVGQAAMMGIWQAAFDDTIVSQHLITNRELETEEGTAFAETLHDCMEQGIVPIINENDGISDQEIRVGDNDTLAARAAAALHRLGKHSVSSLVLLTHVEGFFGESERLVGRAAVTDIPLLRKYVSSEVSDRSTGGMGTKLDAAEIAGAAGIDTFIAPGYRPNCVPQALQGCIGTHFFVAR